ncbi:hypothetical protein V8F06_008087 [Rhypophila decipiens]
MEAPASLQRRYNVDTNDVHYIQATLPGHRDWLAKSTLQLEVSIPAIEVSFLSVKVILYLAHIVHLGLVQAPDWLKLVRQLECILTGWLQVAEGGGRRGQKITAGLRQFSDLTIIDICFSVIISARSLRTLSIRLAHIDTPTMDPLTAAGALASAVQLFDISLRYSHEACKFLSALKHSREDGAMLERTVREVEVLIRSLRMYAAEHQRSSAPSSVHDAMLQRSITHISQHFANDMTALYKVLPRDLSTSMLNRVKFVIRRSETDKLLQRLEQRKSAATMALGIIGRYIFIAIVILQQGTDISIPGWMISSFELGSHRSKIGCLKYGYTDNAHAITMFQEAQTAGITTAISHLEAASIDALVRLVRAELRQQVEPILNNIDGVTERLDNIVMDIGHKANAESLIGTRQCTSISPDPKEKVDESPPSEFFPSEPDTRPTRSRGSKEIPLFSYKLEKDHRKCCQVDVDSQTRFFNLQVDMIPKRWLSSRGLSAFYSSGPDHCGYYSICPSILPFSIIDIASHKVLYLLLEDELQGFRKMLQRGQVGIRDRSDAGGLNLHQYALLYGAHSISLYLLRDSGYGKDFVEQNSGDADFDISQLMTHMRPTYNSFETCTSILSSYKDFLPEGKFIDVSVPWAGIGSMRHSGRHLRDIFLMKLYIETGGSPNLLGEDRFARHRTFGWAPPLLLALDKVVIAWVGDGSEESGFWDDERDGDSVGISGDNSDNEESSESMEAKRDNDKRDEILALSIELLSVLISAGADVHYIHEEWVFTLADFVESWGIQDIWAAALERCELSFDEVKLESTRRLAHHHKLRGATRTGIDVEPLVETGSSNIRQRIPRQVEEVD